MLGSNQRPKDYENFKPGTSGISWDINFFVNQQLASTAIPGDPVPFHHKLAPDWRDWRTQMSGLAPASLALPKQLQALPAGTFVTLEKLEQGALCRPAD